jgi:hypothetical protein
MWSYALLGWSTARRSWFLLMLLFLYQYSVGFIVYKYVKSIVVPLLHRYPGGEVSEAAGRMFWLEAEFQLTKTDLIMPYVWAFVIFLLIRMILTPLLNGGLYYTLSNGDGSRRKTFIQGVRKFAKPFLLLYAVQAILSFAPLLWAVPRVMEAAAASYDWTSIALAVAPYAVGWFAYQGVLDIIFMYIGFSIVSGRSVWSAFPILAKRAFPILTLAVCIFAITAAIGLVTAAASLWWAGFLAIVAHQSYPLVRTLLKLWGISAQHHLWSASKSP